MIRPTPLVIVLLCASAAFAQEDAKTLKLQLKMGKEEYAAGQIPQFDLRWVNGTDKSQQVVRPCDGSQDAFRFPGYVWSIERVDGKPMPTQELGRCGNVNQLAANDFVTLAPRQEHALTVATNHAWLAPPGDGLTWLTPGRYRVSLTYTFDPKDVDQCFGALNGECPPDILKRIQSSPAMTKTTNTAEFEIAELSKAEAKLLKAWQGVQPGWTLDRVTDAVGSPDSQETRAGQTTLGFKIGELTLEVHLQEDKVTSSYIRDYE